MARIPLKSLLENALDDIETAAAVAFSGGVDSASVLFACRDLDIPVTAYTFALDGHASSDLTAAYAACQAFGIDHVPVTLPTDLATLKRDVRYLVQDVGLERKTEIECSWPFLYLFDAVDEPALVTGLCADGNYVLSKRGRMHYSESADAMDDYRREYFADPNPAGSVVLADLAADRGIPEFRAPYRADAVVDAFMGTTWADCHRPNEKQPVRDAYPARLSRIGARRHANLQLGDSGIAAQFERLVETDWNIGDYKTPVGIYNSLARGDI